MSEQIQASEVMQAVDAIRLEARRYKAFVATADVLERIGSVKQLESELTEQIANLRQQVAQAQQQLTDANNQRTASQNEATEEIEKARAKGESLVKSATAEADEIKRAAATEAEATVKSAAEKASKLKGEAAAAQMSLDVARKELAEVEAKIAAAKDAARKLLA